MTQTAAVNNGNGNNVAKSAISQPKSLNKRAFNNAHFTDEVVELKQVAEIIAKMTNLEWVGKGYVMTATGCYHSLFGHGKSKVLHDIATNARIDAALCQGTVMTEHLMLDAYAPTRNCNRNNKYDYQSRPELDNQLNDLFNKSRVYTHLQFLSGKCNGKNTLQKRLLNVLSGYSVEQINEVAEMIHKIAAPMWAKHERCNYPKRHAAHDHLESCLISGTYGCECRTMNDIKTAKRW